jgi:hypothetical protein
VANWKLNETAGVSIADSAGSPQTATLKNSGGTVVDKCSYTGKSTGYVYC